MHDIYLYGSTLVTDSFILAGEFPKGNQYAEYTEHHCSIGGETGICLAILSTYGIPCKADGYHLGTYTAPLIQEHFKNNCVDLSAMEIREDFEGFHDYVLIDRINHTRNCVGPFETLVQTMEHPYNMPKEEDVVMAKYAAIDPFLPDAAAQTAEYCVKHQVPYVTIDCEYDSYLARKSEVAVISEEFISQAYAGQNVEELLQKYMKAGDGLFIFTFGAREVLYGRGGVIKRRMPFQIKAKSTLSAGDSFKCGCVYGLYRGMSDDEMVTFACALAGCACMSYPLAEHIPTLEMVQKLIESAQS